MIVFVHGLQEIVISKKSIMNVPCALFLMRFPAMAILRQSESFTILLLRYCNIYGTVFYIAIRSVFVDGIEYPFITP